jgi:hypothetical protein
MSGFGKYDPTRPEHTSSLFAYGEVPLASEKLNRWNGNLEAALNGFIEAAVTLLGGGEEDLLLPGLSETPLKVVAQNPPSMRVSVCPGRAMVSRYVAGVSASADLPAGTSVLAPDLLPRVDLVALSKTGSLSVVTGEESSSPNAPAIPADSVPLAEIFLRPGAESIRDEDDGTNAYLVDVRPAPLSGRAHRHSQDGTPAEAADGVRTAFSTAGRARRGTLRVYLNGILLKSGENRDYTENPDLSGYVLHDPPRPEDVIQHFYEEE